MLRFFFEQIPELHVIAAGSLLEFVLGEHAFSMPVGRVEYLFLGPLDFYEFMQALDQGRFVEFLNNYSFEGKISESIHQSLLKLVKQFCIVGGMPGAVREYRNQENYLFDMRS